MTRVCGEQFCYCEYHNSKDLVVKNNGFLLELCVGLITALHLAAGYLSYRQEVIIEALSHAAATTIIDRI